MVYLATLPGGWIADRLIGPRRAVLYGGLLIASGHFSMAFPSLSTFYLGLFLIVLGTGLLKGNVSVIVGKLYAQGDSRRDAGFSIFYMGINLGAFIAPLICGYLGQQINWHFGFAAAGVGMTLGVIQYVAGSRNLGDAGLLPAPGTPEQVAKWRRQGQIAGGVLVALILIVGVGGYTGLVPISARQVADAAGVFLLLVIVGFFGWMYSSSEWTLEERKRSHHRRVVPRGLVVLVGLRAGGIDLEPVRRRNTYNAFRLRFSEQLVPVDELLFLIIFAPIAAGMDQDGGERHRAIGTDQVCLGPGARRPRLRDPDSARASERGAREPDVADGHVFPAHYR